MVFQRGFMYQTTDKRPECHACTIVELPSGDLFGAWYAGSREGETDVAVLGSRYHKDDGRWEPAAVLVDTPGEPEGNPVLFVAPGGRLWLFFVTIRLGGGWREAQLRAMSSADEGLTWSKIADFDNEPLGTMPRNKPIILGDRVLLPLYDEKTWRGFVYISDDDCQTWHRSGFIESDGGCIQPTLIPRNDGSILALLRDRQKRHVLQSISSDRGETWTFCQPTSLPNPNSGVDAVRLSSGKVIIAYNHSCEQRTPMSVAISDDEGHTWTRKVDVETDHAEFSYPAIIQSSDGLIHLAYTWRRKGIAHLIFDEEWLEANAQPIP